MLIPHGCCDQVELQLCETSYDNSQLRKEVERLEAQNNHLQGYLLDGMSGSELSRLIRSLTQAVERVRVTVQMRRLTGPSPQLSPRSIPIIMLHEPQQPGLTPQEPQHRLGGGSLPPTPPASPRPPGKAKAETQCPTSSAVTSEARIAYHAPRDLVEKEMDNLQRVMPLRRPMTYSSRERQ